MNSFFDATPLLGDKQALRHRLHEDGYVFLRGVVPREVLSDLRREITGICARHGWFRAGTDPMEAISDHRPVVEGDEAYYPVYNEIQRLESFHALAHQPSLLQTMRTLVGSTAFPRPLSICRLVFPRNDAWATPPHQDYPNNQGTPDLYASWIPLADCAMNMGSLSVLRGSHNLGLLPLKYSLGAGHRQAALEEIPAGMEWVGSDFELGDILVFHSLTVHRSLGNDTDRMRISVDYRYQREGEPLTAECLQSHFRQQTWDEIYAGWENSELKYYWRDKNLPLVPWDPSLHELPEEDFDDAFRIDLAYQKYRDQHFS